MDALSRPGAVPRSQCNPDAGRGLRGNAFAAPGKSETLGRRRLDADARHRDRQQFGDPGSHRFAVRADARALANQCQINVLDLAIGLGHEVARVRKEQARVGAGPARIGGREMVADIAGGDRAKQGVDQRVQPDIGVGVAGQALVMRHRYAAQHDVVTVGREPVHIESGPDTDHGILVRTQNPLGAPQILTCGHLEIVLGTFDQGDTEPGMLGDRRIVRESLVYCIAVRRENIAKSEGL